MKKQLIIIEIIILLIIVGLSGCSEESKETSNQMMINIFQVTPTLIEIGETANLTWDISGATSISIDNNVGTVSLKGTRIIQPEQTTTYTLTATNTKQTIYATTKIIVEGTIPIDYTPDISFIMDDIANILIVTGVSASGLSWNNVNIIGTANKPTGTIEAGDTITGCSGTVSLNWKGTSLIGTWIFNTEPTQTPDIAFIMDDVNDRLTITKVSDTNVPWTDLVITGQLGYVVHNSSAYVTAGDYISNCKGTMTISYQGISLLGTWTFTT